MSTKTRRSTEADRAKGVIVYRGASAPLLPDKPGGRTKKEADAFSAWVLKSVGKTELPTRTKYKKHGFRAARKGRATNP